MLIFLQCHPERSVETHLVPIKKNQIKNCYCFQKYLQIVALKNFCIFAKHFCLLVLSGFPRCVRDDIGGKIVWEVATFYQRNFFNSLFPSIFIKKV